MSVFKNYKLTFGAGIAGFVTQAVINSFAPLLFLTFQNSFNIGLTKVSVLIAVNFFVQLSVDALAAGFAAKLNHRACMVTAHIFAAAGLCGLAVFPFIFGNAFAGLITAVVIYAIGGGLIEVLLTPIIEACPFKNKAGTISLLHSFYCWGLVLVVLGSTGFFFLFGISNWRILAFIWALVPALNAVLFTLVPFFPRSEDSGGMPLKKLLTLKFFLLILLMMICVGAAEQSVAQWASAYAEAGLGVGKTAGDIFGPCCFAVCMALSRLAYSKLSAKVRVEKAVCVSLIFCIASYIVMGLSRSPVLGLAACALCGLSVGILWPGMLSYTSAKIPKGGTAMFALLALAGDFGCVAGPFLAGTVSDSLNGRLNLGILTAIIFPVLLMTLLLLQLAAAKRKSKKMPAED